MTSARRSGALLAALLVALLRGGASAPQPAAATAADVPADSSATDLPFGALTSFLMGAHLLARDDPAGALPYLDYAHRVAPLDQPIADVYVATLLTLARRDEAIAVLTAMAAARPSERGVHTRLASVLADAQRWDEALAAISAARQAGDNGLDVRLLEAEVLARAGRTAQAIDAYRLATVAGAWQNEQAVLMLGALLAEAGRANELPELWREALGANPNASRVREVALGGLAQMGRDTEVIAIAAQGDSLLEGASVATQTHAAIEGGDVEATGAEPDFSWMAQAAKLIVQHGGAQRAIAALEQRRQAGSLSTEGEMWLARLLLHEERWDDGVGVLRAVLNKRPELARARLLLGETLISRGEMQEAEAQLRSAVALAPNDPACLVALVRALALQAGHTGAAAARGSAQWAELARLTSLAGGLVSSDDARGLMILGYALRGLDDLEGAARHFEAASRLPGVRRESLLQLAACQEARESYQEAIATLETLRREFPDDPTVANSLGYLLAERGVELGRAEALVQEALARQPDNPHYVDSLGWVAFQSGDFPKAFDLLVRAANDAPDEPEILEHLARTLWALGRSDEAVTVVRRALSAGGEPKRLQALLRQFQAGGVEP